MEEHCRNLITQGNELYIIAGTFGKSGKGNNGEANSSANGKLSVPTSLWKVIVLLLVFEHVHRMDAQTRVSAIVIPDANATERYLVAYFARA